MPELFSPIRHVPKYSKVLITALLQPMLFFFALVGNGILFACATLFYAFEQTSNPQLNTYFDALWWAFSTVTTVGYGDIVPITISGKIVGIVLMITGISMFVAFTGYLVTGISNLTTEKLFEHDLRLRKQVYVLDAHISEVNRRLSEMEKELQDIKSGTTTKNH